MKRSSRFGGAAQAEAASFKLPAVSGVVPGTYQGEYLGFTVRETSKTSGATIVLYDGTNATGPIIEEISLNAGESTSDHYPRPGRLISTSIYAAITGPGAYTAGGSWKWTLI